MAAPRWREFAPTPAPQATEPPHPVVIVGGGPVGLTLALDLGRRGHRVVVLNRSAFITAGSKAICFSKRTLEVWDRLGVAGPMLDKGVVWNLGKVFWGEGEEPIYTFDLLPLKGQKAPAFINLQQYYAEGFLVDALAALPNVELRWGHELVALTLPPGEDARATVQTGEGRYDLQARWLIACDGARSPVRGLLGLDFEGESFEDNFLIADIRLKTPRPAERWFWFDPPFNPGQSALLHKQPDNVWRLDFQLGWNIDREACVRPENVAPYVRGMLGQDVEFTPEWYSVYTFQCRRMRRFLHDRVIFAGDSAHLVSPFGARGCNGGVADVDNLGWKLDLVLRGAAAEALLESYNQEAVAIADENILNSARTADFLTPKSAASRALRDGVLQLAHRHAFARPFVNSGRLSRAVQFVDSPLSTPDDPAEAWGGGLEPGAPAVDAPLGEGWLLERLGGRFVLLACEWAGAAPDGVDVLDVARLTGGGEVCERYDLRPGSAYLVRPDQYVAARWRAAGLEQVHAALARAVGRPGP